MYLIQIPNNTLGAISYTENFKTPYRYTNENKKLSSRGKRCFQVKENTVSRISFSWTHFRNPHLKEDDWMHTACLGLKCVALPSLIRYYKSKQEQTWLRLPLGLCSMGFMVHNTEEMTSNRSNWAGPCEWHRRHDTVNDLFWQLGDAFILEVK